MADLIPAKSQGLTPAQYGALADVPPELEWLAKMTNPKTRRAYRIDVSEFSAFTGLRSPVELRTVSRAHMIAWREGSVGDPGTLAPPASGASFRRYPR